MLGAMRLRQLQFFVSACGGNDRSPKQCREFDGGKAHATGSTEYQDRFAGLQLGPLL